MRRRGFAEARAFDLDAEVVVVHGDNGSGKTSLVDGLVWVLTGAVSRLTERMRGRRRGEDPLVNVYAPGPARVRLELTSDGGRHFAFEHVGTIADSTLRASENGTPLPDAEALLARSSAVRLPRHLTEAVETLGVLQQQRESA